MATSSKPPRRNNTDPESTRREILQAALEVLAKDGPESLSVAEVARRAGVNRGTAYQHFPTREDLAHATASWVSERMYQAFYGDFEAVVGSERGLSAGSRAGAPVGLCDEQPGTEPGLVVRRDVHPGQRDGQILEAVCGGTR